MKSIRVTSLIAIVVTSIGALAACGTMETGQSNAESVSVGYGPGQEAETEEYLLDDTLSDKDIDKEAKYRDYLEGTLTDDIMDAYSAIRRADVVLSGNLGEMRADICLELQDDFTKDNAAAVAKAVAAAIEDELVERVIIQDTEGNVLFPGNG